MVFTYFRFKSRRFMLVFSILFMLMLSMCLNLSSALKISSEQIVEGDFDYQFIVDEDGFTKVKITYVSDAKSGSSWVFVPKFSKWINYTVDGKVYEWSLEDPEKYVGEQYYFYKVLSFGFLSNGSQFEMVVEFNFSTAAIIIEPDGMFYSPQIGFAKGSNFRASVIFPSSFRINLDEAVAIGASGMYRPKYLNSSFVSFDSLPLTENLLRIQIGFKVPNKNPDVISIESGVFRFKTVRRYEAYAHEILDLYNATYKTLVDLFNTTFEDGAGEKITVRFFIPDFNSLLSIGGYVPFSGQKMGDIHINFMFTRYVKGYLEVIALHELVHHFLWRAGISPQSLLWFHEGMAQYVSIEVAGRLNYTGVEMIRRDLENRVQDLEAEFDGGLGFLAYWSPSVRPRSMGVLYTAAYYVVSRLASSYGGIDYYARVFRLVKGEKIESNAMLCYYLSLAAGESVAAKFRQWGFNVPDLYTFSPFLAEVERAVGNVNPAFQPFKYLAEVIYKFAMQGGKLDAKYALLFLAIAFLIASFAPILTLMTYSGLLFILLILLLKKKHVL